MSRPFYHKVFIFTTVFQARESDSAREFNTELDLTSWKAKVNVHNIVKLKNVNYCTHL